MMRGSCALVTCPKLVSPNPASTPLKLVWLNTLKYSPRSWNLRCPPRFTFLIVARSHFCTPGPSSGSELSVPKCPTAAAKEEVENHCALVLVFLTGAAWFGRMAMSPSALMPNPLGPTELNGSFGWVTSNEEPETKDETPESSQPPRTCPSNPCWPLQNGRL